VQVVTNAGQDDTAGLNPTKGRLRTCLMKCVENEIKDSYKTARAQRRRSGFPAFSWEDLGAEEFHQRESADGHTAEQSYDRVWADSILEHALERLRLEFKHHSTGSRFDNLEGLLYSNHHADRYLEVAARLNTSDQAIKGVIHSLRKRLREVL
jgi:DNA-directed RNA polymerase specialized sigma24 family protein